MRWLGQDRWGARVSHCVRGSTPQLERRLSKSCALPCAGVDSGVFLVRNGPFIRALFDRLADTARSLPLPASYVSASRDSISQFCRWACAALLRGITLLRECCRAPEAKVTVSWKRLSGKGIAAGGCKAGGRHVLSLGEGMHAVRWRSSLERGLLERRRRHSGRTPWRRRSRP